MPSYRIIDISVWMDDFKFPGNPDMRVMGPYNHVNGDNPEYVYDFEFCSQSGTYTRGTLFHGRRYAD